MHKQSNPHMRQNLHVPHVPTITTQAHIFPELCPYSIISLGQLCDHGCGAAFDLNTVTVQYNNKTILQGHGCAAGLWQLSSTPTMPIPSIWTQWQNIQSTKPQQDAQTKTQYVLAAIYDPTMDTDATTGNIYGDLTGQFPVQSRQCSKYILLVQRYNNNTFLVVSLCNHPTIQQAYGTIVTRLKTWSFIPKTS